MKPIILILFSGLFVLPLTAAEPPPVMSAKDLATKLSVLQEDGSSFVRLKLNATPADGKPKFSLQLQIKQRRTPKSTELVYQVLWPKERAGESVLLRQSDDQAASVMLFFPPDTLRAIGPAQMNDGLFGSDLAYADILENFFSWDNQTIVGSEPIGRVSCQILESKPGNGQRSIYSVVRTWVDVRRLVPMKIEKYQSSGKLVRLFETTDVATDDMRRFVPANLKVSSPQAGTFTELDGSKLKHGVKLADTEFTPEGIKKITTPPSGPE